MRVNRPAGGMVGFPGETEQCSPSFPAYPDRLNRLPMACSTRCRIEYNAWHEQPAGPEHRGGVD